MKLYDTGVYLLNGQKIVPENQADFPVSKEEAAKSTIAYSILKAHNTSGNMDKLQIKFDKLTSHDITFVGIIQTARVPTATCPYGRKMTICLDLPVPRNMAAYMYRLIRQLSISLQEKCLQQAVK